MASQDFSIYSGDSLPIAVTVTNSSGAAVDLTSGTIKWAVISNNTSILTLSVGNGITVTNATAGQFTINLSSSNTQSWNGTYKHEARFTDSSGNSSIIFVGNLNVTKSYV